MAKAKVNDSPTRQAIIETAAQIRAKILKKASPQMAIPLRALSNVIYRPRKGYFELQGKKKVRTLTHSTVKTFAQTLKMMALAKELIEKDDIATKRDAYYQSKNWGEARLVSSPRATR
jgi:DNA topoisomerase VI subunit A